MSSTPETNSPGVAGEAQASSGGTSKRSLPISRVILLVILVILVAALFMDSSQRSARKKADAEVNKLLTDDVEATKEYMRSNNLRMPIKERKIAQTAIRKLLKETYNRDVDPEGGELATVDRFVWSGIFYTYVLNVEYTAINHRGPGPKESVLIGLRTITDSKFRFAN